MTYKRKCKNWLEDFRRWSLPRSEAPDSFITWTGYFTMAAAVRRHVRIPKRLFGSWEAAPNLYVIFIAPPGKARKSTTASYGEAILDGVNESTLVAKKITKAPAIVTTAALLNRLVNSDDKSLFIVSSEFSSLINKSGLEMFEFLTDLFDGRKNIEASTISRGVEFAERPCVNLLAATTPRWVSENMPESVIGGGFASRVIFVYAEQVRRRQLYYEDLDHEALDKLQQNLIDDLAHISTIEGDFELEDDAKAFMEEWYRNNADNPPDNYRLAGYYERKPAHIHKLAMLIHLSYSDDLVIQKADFVKAIQELEKIETDLPKVFESVGKNEYSPEMGHISDYLQEKGRVTRSRLLRDFKSAARPTIIEEMLQALAAMGYIKAEIEGKEVVYVYTGG